MLPDGEAIAEQVFSALADPTRRAIVATLAAQGPATATDLADRLPITRQAISKHLLLLADAGLVTPEPGERRREGQCGTPAYTGREPARSKPPAYPHIFAVEPRQTSRWGRLILGVDDE